MATHIWRALACGGHGAHRSAAPAQRAARPAARNRLAPGRGAPTRRAPGSRRAMRSRRPPNSLRWADLVTAGRQALLLRSWQGSNMQNVSTQVGRSLPARTFAVLAFQAEKKASTNARNKSSTQSTTSQPRLCGRRAVTLASPLAPDHRTTVSRSRSAVSSTCGRAESSDAQSMQTRCGKTSSQSVKTDVGMVSMTEVTLKTREG